MGDKGWKLYDAIYMYYLHKQSYHGESEVERFWKMSYVINGQ